jgi:hypothetical protein
MRHALAALACVLVSAGSYAQRPEHLPAKPPSKGHTVSRDAQPPKGQPSPAAKLQREEENERSRAPRLPAPDPARPQNQRAKERVPGDPPNDPKAHTVSRDSQPPKGPPSPAAKLQQQQTEQFQDRTGDSARTVGCSAHPVCSRGVGTCQGVVRSYSGTNVAAAERDIARRCVQANRADICDCAAQCGTVARCSIF